MGAHGAVQGPWTFSQRRQSSEEISSVTDNKYIVYMWALEIGRHLKFNNQVYHQYLFFQYFNMEGILDYLQRSFISLGFSWSCRIRDKGSRMYDLLSPLFLPAAICNRLPG